MKILIVYTNDAIIAVNEGEQSNPICQYPRLRLSFPLIAVVSFVCCWARGSFTEACPSLLGHSPNKLTVQPVVANQQRRSVTHREAPNPPADLT